MKNYLISGSSLLLAIATIFWMNSCSKISTITLHKTYSDVSFIIPAPQPAGTFEIEREIEADLQDLASTNGFDISKIESASINSISLQINDSSLIPVTFDIVDNAVCTFDVDGTTVSEVGTDDAVHTSASQMDFDLKGVDVTPYLKSTHFKVKMKMTTNAPITHDVPMTATIACSFKVKPFKK